MQGCAALLGRKDAPTDAVEDYCQYLREALREHNFDLRVVRCGWAEVGWAPALEQLRRQATEWSGAWVLLQYTALAWSSRGFPLRFLRVLEILQLAGARIGIVFHDVEPYTGQRWVDFLRRRTQLHVMRKGLQSASLAVFTVPMEGISWIERAPTGAVFIPVGANLPAPETAWKREPNDTNRIPTIAVFGITGGQAGIFEMASISDAVRFVAERIGKVRLLVLGRNSETAKDALGRLTEDAKVEIAVRGVIPAHELVKELGAADVLFFVRGTVSTRRGSAIAGISCGLPIVALEGPETSPLIAEAGVVFADPLRREGFGESLLRILKDEAYRELLSQRSRRAQDRYFSWKVIAAHYVDALRERN